MSFGGRLRVLRRRKGLSAAECAEKIGVAPSTYREWENGRSILGEPYIRIADVLGITISELITGEKSEPSRDIRDAISLLKGAVEKLEKLNI